MRSSSTISSTVFDDSYNGGILTPRLVTPSGFSTAMIAKLVENAISDGRISANRQGTGKKLANYRGKTHIAESFFPNFEDMVHFRRGGHKLSFSYKNKNA